MLTSLVSNYEGLTDPLASNTSKEIVSCDEDDMYTDALLGTWAELIPLIARLAWTIRRQKRQEARDHGVADTTSAILSIETKLLERGNLHLQATTSPPNHQRSDWAPSSPCSEDFLLSSSPITLSLDDATSPAMSDTPEHYEQVSEAYRLSALLHLYQSCPGILIQRLAVVNYIDRTSCHEFLQRLACSILELMRDIPSSHRLFNVASFPLMMAGQHCTSVQDRTWVLSIFEELRVRNGIAAVTKLAETLEIVWKRRDAGQEQTWIDVFEEQDCHMLIN